MIKAADWRRTLCAAMGEGPGGGDQRETKTESGVGYIPLIRTITPVSADVSFFFLHSAFTAKWGIINAAAS